MEHLTDFLNNLIANFGGLGVFVAMIFESSIIPIPSELVIIGAGSLGISLYSILVFGTLGSVLGGCIGYCIGRYLGLSFVLKLEKILFIKQKHIEKAQNFAKKYGTIGVLIGRLLPIIPFKVFSIVAGFTKIPFIPFVVYTFIGVIPRILILSLFGHLAVHYTKIFGLILVTILVIFLIYKFIVLYFLKSKNNKDLLK